MDLRLKTITYSRPDKAPKRRAKKRYILLTPEEFDAQFTLLPNPVDKKAFWKNKDGKGCFFDIGNKELTYLGKQNPKKVWTMRHGDDDDEGETLYSGFVAGNRIGYLLTAENVPDNIEYAVAYPPEEEEGE